MKPLLMLASLILAAPVFAEPIDCNCDEEVGKASTIVTKESAEGRTVTLKIPQKPVRISRGKSFLCTDNDAKLKSAKLLMNMHGGSHGARPTKITEGNDRCTLLDEVDLWMKGNWEYHIVFDDKDKVVMKLSVEAKLK
jgi:hypothetical protein